MNYQLPASVTEHLIEEATSMQSRSYIPYSGYAVGAALLTADGKIYTGCNIENAAYTPTNCAERTAFFKAVSEGERDFTAIAVVGGKGRQPIDACTPCGVCRQVMMEFCDPDSFLIITARRVRGAADMEIRQFTLRELLPEGFGPKNLDA